MATTFNFTVRAEDDQGAFADREFSINVRNTVVDRYMIIDSADAYTSPDLVNWTKRANQGGYAVNYGGGKWIITMGPNFSTYRISTDGVNFETRTLTVNMTGLSMLFVDHEIVWNNGYWWVNCRAVGSWSAYRYVLLKSSDGLTWQTVAEQNIGQVSSITPTFVGDKMFVVVNSQVHSFNNTTSGVTSLFSPTLPAMNLGSGTITSFPPYKINGLWIFPRQSTAAFGNHYSADGINWYAGETISSSNRTHDRTTYINGVLFTQYTLTSASNGSGPLMSSDGKKWTMAATGSSGAIAGGTKSFVFMTKGKVHFIVSSVRRSSSDLGETWEDFTLPMDSITGFAMIR